MAPQLATWTIWMGWLSWAVAALALTAIHALLLVPRLAEPEDGAKLGKRRYANLATPLSLAVLATLAIGTQTVSATVEGELSPLWLVAGSGLLTLVWVDALTTWLPTQLLRLVAGELAVALLIGAVLSPTPVTLLSRVLVGALASGVVFTTLWWFTRGFGFGDVRLAPLIGAVAGSLGSSGWYAALLAGSLVGVVWGLAARRHPAPGTSSGFAYGPALWCGPYLAYALCQLVQASS